jgi:hypothetical protein
MSREVDTANIIPLAHHLQWKEWKRRIVSAINKIAGEDVTLKTATKKFADNIPKRRTDRPCHPRIERRLKRGSPQVAHNRA